MNPKINNIFSQFAHRKAALFQQLDQLSQQQLSHQPSEQEWSIIQVLDHLKTSEQGSLVYCKKKIKAGDELSDASPFEGIKMWGYLQFLYSKIKFKAPAMVSAPSNDYMYSAIREKHTDFQMDLEQFLENYPDQYFNKAIYKHPIAGRISLVQMVRFFDAHLRHHLYQIDRLIKQSKNL